MTSIITTKCRVEQAELFKNSVGADGKNHYLFIGKSSPWSDETSPDTPINVVSEEYQHWFDMLALKAISASNVTHVIPRINYAANAKFIPYKVTDPDIFDHPTIDEIAAAQSGGYTAGACYCVTDEMKVYLCIDNADNSLTDAEGLGKPTFTDPDVQATSDGYKWKYLYTISAAEILNYVTDSWIPVKTLESDDESLQWDVQAAAIDGSIEAIQITASGSGYDRTNTGTTSGGSLGGLTTTINNGNIVTDNYYKNAAIYLSDGQVRNIVSYTAATQAVTVNSAWTANPAGLTYEILPQIQITGNGSGAIAKATVVAGEITDINMVVIGSGYKTATVTILPIGDPSPAGTGATAIALLAPAGGHGADPVQELGASYIMLNCRLDYAEGTGDFPINNDYRKIGVIVDVLNWDGSLATLSTRRAVKTLTLSAEPAADFTADETITQSGSPAPTAKMIEVVQVGSDWTMKYYQNASTGFTDLTTGTITGSTSGATATVTAVNNPEVLPFSGKIIYISQRRPITRSIEQKETVRVILEF